MDERLSGWEDRLRRELDASVRDVRVGDDLLVAARDGGRRRVRRRRALVTLPAAVVVVGGAVGSVWAGVGRQAAPQPVTPASSPAPTPVVATTPPVLTLTDEDAWGEFFAAGYEYDDAVTLGQLWNVSVEEAKALGGQALADGETLPISH